MIKIKLSSNSTRFLQKLSTKHANQIKHKLISLQQNPYPHDSKKLKEYENFWRTDCGEYRIIYTLESEILHIYLVGKRNDNEVYTKLKRLTQRSCSIHSLDPTYNSHL